MNIGATAIGTSLNAGDDYRRLVIANLARYTTLPLKPATNLFRVTQSMGDVLAYSGAMRRLAVEVSKVANDLRLLSMGPRAGLSEISLPAVQPGSSIMPGKVNPSVPEMVNQVCFQVMGCDQTVALACEAGQLAAAGLEAVQGELEQLRTSVVGAVAWGGALIAADAAGDVPRGGPSAPLCCPARAAAARQARPRPGAVMRARYEPLALID